MSWAERAAERDAHALRLIAEGRIRADVLALVGRREELEYDGRSETEALMQEATLRNLR